MRNTSPLLSERLKANADEAMREFSYLIFQQLPAHANFSRRWGDEPWHLGKPAEDLRRASEGLEILHMGGKKVDRFGRPMKPEELALFPEHEGISRREFAQRIFDNYGRLFEPHIALTYELARGHQDFRLALPFSTQRTPADLGRREGALGEALWKIGALASRNRREREYLRAREAMDEADDFKELRQVVRQHMAFGRLDKRFGHDYHEAFARATKRIERALRVLDVPPREVAGKLARYKHLLGEIREEEKDLAVLLEME